MWQKQKFFHPAIFLQKHNIPLRQKKVLTMSFAHLHVHTDYSVDGIARIPKLFAEAERLGLQGLAITDHGTMAGVPAFLREAEKHPGVKPVVGCEFYIETDTRLCHLILLAKDLAGYHSLIRLCSFARQGPDDARPCITHELLERYHAGLVCSSACIGGEIPQAILAGDIGKARDIARWYKDIFGEDFYLEVALHAGGDDVPLASCDDREAYNRSNDGLVAKQIISANGIFRLSGELGIKVIVTNDVHFVRKDDAIAQDAFLCRSHRKRLSDPNRIRYSHLEYLKSEEEMRTLYPEHPEVADNTGEVLGKISRYSIAEKPSFPKLSDHPDKALLDAVSEGAAARYGTVTRSIEERMLHEVSAIWEKGLSDYFLMLKEMVDWARSRGIAVGVGRGASPSSIVCYCLRITEVDPLRHGLLFERFLRTGHGPFPPVDIDFEAARKEEVIGHLKERYGQDCVALVPYYWTMEKGSAWDIVDMDPLRGVIWNQSISDNTVIISPGPLWERLPVEIAEGLPGGDHTLLSQYDGRGAEEAGVVKINLVSLSVLDVIKESVRLIRKRRRWTDIRLEEIPLDDGETLKVFDSGDTADIFMFQCEGDREWLKAFAPNSFSDLVLLNALYRPGPMEFLPECLARKRGEKKAVYEIPGLEDILSESYGLPAYQEQIMQIGRLVGLDPEDSGMLWKRVGIRTLSSPDLKELFIESGVRKGHPAEVMEALYARLEKEGSYAFNKSHSVCYTLHAFRCAWLKANYPEEYARAYSALTPRNMKR